MKNKQLENKQIENKDTLLKKAGRIVAPLLVAGIMTVTGNADAGKTKETGAPLLGANIVSGKITKCLEPVKKCTKRFDFLFEKSGYFEVETQCPEVKNKCEMKVKKGDVIYKIEFVTEAAGYFGLKVANVDKKGVTFQTDMEIFMSESAGGKFRVNYDGTNTIPKTEAFMSEHSSFQMKVKRTSDPKVAKVILGK